MALQLTRRQTLVAGGLGALMPVLMVRPGNATPASLEAAIRDFVGAGAQINQGRVKLDIPALVENGNSAPVNVTVESPMTVADHVRAVAIFNEKNPESNVAVFHIGPRAGRAWVSTRMRLANTQKIVAVARLSDGSCWSDSAEVIVTLAACVEN